MNFNCFFHDQAKNGKPLTDLTIPSLKKELKRRRLPYYGNKPDLVGRLQAHLRHHQIEIEEFLFPNGSILQDPDGIKFNSEEEFEAYFASPEEDSEDSDDDESDSEPWVFEDDDAAEIVRDMTGKTAFDVGYYWIWQIEFSNSISICNFGLSS